MELSGYSTYYSVTNLEGIDMRKQFTFVPVTVNNQNELIDALNNDESAIVFTGSEIQEIGKKIKRAHDDKSLFKVLTGVGVLNAVGCIGMLSIPFLNTSMSTAIPLSRLRELCNPIKNCDWKICSGNGRWIAFGARLYREILF